MKKVFILMVLFFTSFFAKAQEVVLTQNFGSGSVVLERKTDQQSFRQNRDGSRFYKTTFTIKVNSGNQKWSKEMTDIYSDKGTAMEPCMLIDEANKLLYVFALSKSDEHMYGMDGIVFRLDMGSGKWTRENVFSKANWGWFAYFGGLVNGNPELWHFSFSGYRSMCSTRNNNGGWSNADKGSQKPDQAANQRTKHNNVLVTGSPNISVGPKGGGNGGNGVVNGHTYVDLGLPSGTLWATCNVGATTPEGYGYYFAWGETQPKTTYQGNTYKYRYVNGSTVKLTKYCSKIKSIYGINGVIDNLITLLPEDDAATANWGSGWCMPTKDQWEELYQNTTHTWTTQNGVNGRLFTASNGNSLFLPAAGYRWGGELVRVGRDGNYWSSSLYTGYSYDAWIFYFGSGCGTYGMNHYDRSNGHSVRAVRSARR